MSLQNQTVAAAIVAALNAMQSCWNAGNTAWADKWNDRLEQLQQLLPSGSGFDSGTLIDRDRTSARRITLNTAFHHMDENGVYVTWTAHTVIVEPRFYAGSCDIRVTGRNRNDIKEYIADAMATTLSAEAPPYPWQPGKA